MTDGQAGEYDHPYRLLVQKVGDNTITSQSSLFAQMVLATGEETAACLFQIAKESYDRNGQRFPYEKHLIEDVL